MKNLDKTILIMGPSRSENFTSRMTAQYVLMHFLGHQPIQNTIQNPKLITNYTN